jgi:lipid-A-disaccharide synthase
VKEMIQDEASPENIAAEMGAVLSDPAYENEIRNRLAAVRSLLGGGGAAENVARLVVSMMEQA